MSMIRYQPVELDFLSRAPMRLDLSTVLDITPSQLFSHFEDPDAWGWASIKSVDWETPKPYGPGPTRTIEVEGQGKIQERFLLWEQDQRFVFRFEQGEMKLVSAFMEDYRVTPMGDSKCRFDWTICMQLRGPLRLFTPLIRGVMKKQFSSMLPRLVAQIST